jgi:RNAse (barnase) inhibitor barstar
VLNPDRSGVYRAPPHVESMRTSLEPASRWIDVDLASVRNKREMLSALQDTCGFPATFGHNWDALADALQDMSCNPAPAYVLHLRHSAQAARYLDGDWAMLMEVLTESAEYWKAHDKPFIVFVEGAAELPPWT